jgi:dTMP kinase
LAAGLFFTFEGPEGAGKSTQVRMLARHLSESGHAVCSTREPGGTAIGERIRDVLLSGSSVAMRPETEALLLTAARAQHVHEVIGPALLRSDIVLSDRYVESTLAYQGGGRGLPLETLEALQKFATGGLSPDLRILLDLPVEQGLRRRQSEASAINRIDEESVGFHRRVREAYRAMAKANPAGWTVIDATLPIEVVAKHVRDAVALLLARRSQGCAELAESAT